jgi:hypothetical protein
MTALGSELPTVTQKLISGFGYAVVVRFNKHLMTVLSVDKPRLTYQRRPF